MTKTIQEIKTEFEQVLGDVSKISGMTTESAVQVASLILQESGKDRRAELYNSRNNGFNRNYNNGNGGEKPASQKQIDFLKDLGAENIPKTSREANALITQLKAKRGI